MKNIWKNAGELIGNLFTSHPQISEEEKTALKTALDQDANEAVTAANARISELEGQLQTAQEEKTELQSEKDALQQKVTSLEATNSSLTEKLAGYEDLKTQMENYQAQVTGTKPSEGKIPAKAAGDLESYEEKEADLDRIKGELKYCAAGL